MDDSLVPGRGPDSEKLSGVYAFMRAAPEPQLRLERVCRWSPASNRDCSSTAGIARPAGEAFCPPEGDMEPRVPQVLSGSGRCLPFFLLHRLRPPSAESLCCTAGGLLAILSSPSGLVTDTPQCIPLCSESLSRNLALFGFYAGPSACGCPSLRRGGTVEAHALL